MKKIPPTADHEEEPPIVPPPSSMTTPQAPRIILYDSHDKPLIRRIGY